MFCIFEMDGHKMNRRSSIKICKSLKLTKTDPQSFGPIKCKINTQLAILCHKFWHDKTKVLSFCFQMHKFVCYQTNENIDEWIRVYFFQK